LALQKRDFLSQFNRYDGKEEDPFYKVEDRGSKIKEDSNFYYLSAYVPEHEKDSISVVVQKDKVTVQGPTII
jgi:HSP20 family molecular chaperone IbpA